MVYPLPRATARAVAAAWQNRRVRHGGLFVHAFLEYPRAWDFQAPEMTSMAYEALRVSFCSPEVSRLLRALHHRQDGLLDGFRRRGWAVWDRRLSARTRVLVGWSSPGVLDVGMTLHRTYGIPYIPATALKGLAARAHPGTRALGTPDRKGEIVFLDAFPVELCRNGEPIVERDVITPHYGRYYGGTSPPAEYWEQPVPVPFLVIRAGTVFRFCLAGPDGGSLGQVARDLEAALRVWGIGAKTRAGYGRLSQSP